MAYVFRAQLRRRWLAWAALGLLVGVAAGAVIALAAGARRTESVYDRFLEETRAFDVGVQLACGIEDRPEPLPNEDCLDRLGALPGVVDATSLTLLTQNVALADGTPTQPTDDPCYSGPGMVLLAADPAGRFGTELNRFHLLEGRLPVPTAENEVVAPVDLAHRFGLHPGDELLVSVGADCSTEVEVPSAAVATEAPDIAPRRLEIVGVGAAPFVVEPPTGDYFNLVLGTPALLEEVLRTSEGLGTTGVVRLEGGEGAVDPFLEDAADLGIPVANGTQRQSQHAETMQRHLRPQATALVLVALVGALAVALVLGTSLLRQARLDAVHDDLLAAVGADRGQRSRLAASRGLVVGAIAAIVATATAVLLSGLFPTGAGGIVETDPGLVFEGTVVVPGVVLVLVVVVGASMLGWWRSSRGMARPPELRRGRTQRLVVALAAMGAPPTATSGIRMALEPGSGAASVPVRSSLVGVLVGFTLLVGALTFSAGLTHLFDTPRLIGWNWDVGVPLSGPEDEDPRDAVERVAAIEDAVGAQPGVTATGTSTFFNFISGAMAVGDVDRRVALLAFGEGSIGPTVVSGRAPRSRDEILLGTETLDETGLAAGDEVDLIVADNAMLFFGGSPRQDAFPFTIVGTGVIPISGGDARLGRGAITTVSGVQRFFPEAMPEVLWLRLTPGTDPVEVVRAAAEELGVPPPARADIIGFSDLDDQLSSVRSIDRVPVVLAGLVGLMAAGVLAHVVISAIRARGHELALLQTVGFVRRQLLATVGWQATVMTAMALVLAVPLGVVGGRAAWRVYADSLGVAPEPVVPVATLAIAAAVVLVGANLVALVPAWRASRRELLDALRAE